MVPKIYYSTDGTQVNLHFCPFVHQFLYLWSSFFSCHINKILLFHHFCYFIHASQKFETLSSYIILIQLCYLLHYILFIYFACMYVIVPFIYCWSWGWGLASGKGFEMTWNAARLLLSFPSSIFVFILFNHFFTCLVNK